MYAETSARDMLIMDISLSTRKVAMRKLSGTALQPSALKVCEAKPAPVLASFVSVSLRCEHIQHVRDSSSTARPAMLLTELVT